MDRNVVADGNRVTVAGGSNGGEACGFGRGEQGHDVASSPAQAVDVTGVSRTSQSFVEPQTPLPPRIVRPYTSAENAVMNEGHVPEGVDPAAIKFVIDTARYSEAAAAHPEMVGHFDRLKQSALLRLNNRILQEEVASAVGRASVAYQQMQAES